MLVVVAVALEITFSVASSMTSVSELDELEAFKVNCPLETSTLPLPMMGPEKLPPLASVRLFAPRFRLPAPVRLWIVWFACRVSPAPELTATFSA